MVVIYQSKKQHPFIERSWSLDSLDKHQSCIYNLIQEGNWLLLGLMLNKQHYYIKFVMVMKIVCIITLFSHTILRVVFFEKQPNNFTRKTFNIITVLKVVQSSWLNFKESWQKMTNAAETSLVYSCGVCVTVKRNWSPTIKVQALIPNMYQKDYKDINHAMW